MEWRRVEDNINEKMYCGNSQCNVEIQLLIAMSNMLVSFVHRIPYPPYPILFIQTNPPSFQRRVCNMQYPFPPNAIC